MRTSHLSLLTALALTACGGASMDNGDQDFGDADTAAPSPGFDTPTGDDADSDAGGGAPPPAETEDDDRRLRPAEAGGYVFIANPDADSLTRVNAATLEVRTTPVGDSPSDVRVTPDGTLAVVFNRGDTTISLVDAEALTARAVPVRPNLNQLELSPNGRWAILWHDPDVVPVGTGPSSAAVSFSEASLVDLASATHHPLVIGFAAKSVTFTPDGAVAILVADASLAAVDLSGATPRPTFIPIADPLAPPLTEEVAVAPSGHTAFVRQRDVAALTVVDLLGRAVQSVPVGDDPSDLDLTADGRQLVVVSRGSATVQVFDVEHPTDPPVVTPIPDSTPLGSIDLAPDGSAVLYTTASDVGRYAQWRVGDDAMTLHPLPKPVDALRRSSDGSTLLVVHDSRNNDDGSTPEDYRYKPALSLVALGTGRTNTLSLIDDVAGYAMTSDGRYAYAILQDRAWFEVLDLQSLIFEELPLRSPAVFVGTLPDLDPTDGDAPAAWVSQAHALGRITFWDPDTRVDQTLTGFALNGAIED
jgi:DNA-binding beta-propeller fold protein YncE